MYAQVNAEDSRTDGPADSPESAEGEADPSGTPESEHDPEQKRRYRGKPESEEARAARDAGDRRLVRRLKQGDERA